MATIAAELTADRFSLLAVNGDLAATVRLELACMTLDSPSHSGANEQAYLADVRRRIEAHEGPAWIAGPSDYPSSDFRLYATWLFWRSDVHRELAGTGPGDLALRDVDIQLRERLDDDLARYATLETSPWKERQVQITAEHPEPPLIRAPRTTHVPVEERVQMMATSATFAVGKFLKQVTRTKPPARVEPSTVDEEVDDLELRFRELEREAERSGTQSRRNWKLGFGSSRSRTDAGQTDGRRDDSRDAHGLRQEL
jgi:hypothetical protein